MRGLFLVLNIVLLLCAGYAGAQPRKIVKEGNQLYQDKKYKEAAAVYQQALQKDPSYLPGLFNLGNSLYQQKDFEAARKAMDASAKTAKDKPAKAAAHYNSGNTYMEEKKWQEAVNAYKQALKNNPQDADAKYNLSYAQAMLKKEGGGGGGKDKNEDKKDENKDQQNKDNENKDENKDNKDEQNQQQQQDKQEQEKEDQRPQPQPSKLSEQQAEQLLNALQQEEKKLQDKMQKGKAVPVKVEKDW